MILQVFFLHFDKIIKTLTLRLLLDSKDHFSHLFALELIKTPSIFLNHWISLCITIRSFLSIIEYAGNKTSPHLPLALNVSLSRNVVLVLLLILHILSFRLLKLWICLGSVAYSLRQLGLLIEILRSLTLGSGCLALLNLLGLRPIVILLVVYD